MIISDKAKSDIIKILAEYVSADKNLAISFNNLFQSKIDLIDTNPLMYQAIYKNI